jgi:hypothetical protein
VSELSDVARTQWALIEKERSYHLPRKEITVKLSALLISLAVAATGSALAASDTPSDTASGNKPPAAHHGMHKQAKAKTDNAKGSTHHMGAKAAPETDLESHDRQTRIDEAYNKWRSGQS